jgi:UDP-N-acetylglucosamine 2-epimerase
MCDMMVVWGEHSKRLLVERGMYESERVAVCGFPRLDLAIAGLPSRSKTLAQLNISPKAQVVLCTSTPLVSIFLSDILDSIQRLPDPSGIYWIIKLHPQEKTRHIWQRAIDQRQLTGIKVVEGEFDFYALLAACDIHMTHISTTLIEAAVLGKLNLGLTMKHFPGLTDLEEANAFLPVAPDQVGQAVYNILHEPSQREVLLRKQREFAKDWCLYDGQAVQRIVRFVEATIANSY